MPRSMISYGECPNDDQGLLLTRVTTRGRVIVMCDVCAEVWLHPDDVGQVPSIYPRPPDFRVTDDVDVIPGTFRLATEADLGRVSWPKPG